MDKRFFVFLVIIVAASIVPISDAQVSVGEKAQQKSVEVTINAEGDVHVKHIVRSSETPRQLELIYGTVSNLSVTNNQGKNTNPMVIGDNLGVLILPSESDSVVEYNLDDVLLEIDKVWTWDFRYIYTTSFILPDEAELVFANERPVFLDDKKGIACHGCQMILEYSINEPKIFEKIKWEDKEFLVEIRTHSGIEQFAFDQSAKSISFDVLDENEFITTIIPLELLWGPYAVFLDDEKIYFHEYINNGTHVWLNVRPQNTGEISITGTTVVPEFPIVAPLAIGFLMIMILPLARKINLR